MEQVGQPPEVVGGNTDSAGFPSGNRTLIDMHALGKVLLIPGELAARKFDAFANDGVNVHSGSMIAAICVLTKDKYCL